MPEKEPKFEPTGAPVEKTEEKEVEKSSEEMLKQVLPLAWEEALKFAQENGFATTEEVKKRIDLAEKYDLEIEHFFYDSAKLEREMPTQEQIEETAKELQYVNEFANEFSRQSQKPVFCIFNARDGIIYSYGIDTLNTQLNFQFGQLAEKEGKTIQELRDEFTQDLKINERWKENKKLAVMKVAEKRILENKSECLIMTGTDFKIPSGSGDFDAYHFGNYDWLQPFNKIIIDKGSTQNESFSEALEVLYGRLNWRGYFCNKVIKVESFGLDRESGLENAVEDCMGKMAGYNVPVEYNWFLREFGLDLEAAAEKYPFLKPMSEEELKQLAPLLNSERPTTILWNPSGGYAWWDNWPELLGKAGKKFGSRSHIGGSYPTEQIVQSAQQVEYLSEKVKNALRYYQKDEEGRNWFERNFEGIMLGKKDASRKDTPEYLAMFKKWVPYETDEKGEAILDDKGYPVPRKTAPMTVAAEDELARIEAAMEELER